MVMWGPWATPVTEPEVPQWAALWNTGGDVSRFTQRLRGVTASAENRQAALTPPRGGSVYP